MQGEDIFDGEDQHVFKSYMPTSEQDQFKRKSMFNPYQVEQFKAVQSEKKDIFSTKEAVQEINHEDQEEVKEEIARVDMVISIEESSLKQIIQEQMSFKNAILRAEKNLSRLRKEAKVKEPDRGRQLTTSIGKRASSRKV